MIHVDGNPGFSGAKVVNADGSFAVKKLSGLFASKQPDGSWQERPTQKPDGTWDPAPPNQYVPGPWETFRPTNNPNLAVIHDSDAPDVSFLVAYAETPDA